MSRLAHGLVVVAVALLLAACSLAPKRLPSPSRLGGYVTLREATYARIPNALLTVSRCFRARGLIRACDSVPLAEYRSDELGRFVVFIALEGSYTFEARACLNGAEHAASQSLDVYTGMEVLEPFELQPDFGRRC